MEMVPGGGVPGVPHDIPKPGGGGMFGPGRGFKESPLVQLEERVKKADETVGILAGLVQGLMKRVEELEAKK